MIIINIKITYAYAQGESHKRINTPCEDYASGIKLKNSSAVIALSDGGGTKKYSKETANVLVNTAKELINNDELYNYKSNEIVKIMNNAVYGLNKPIEDTGATLLFVVIKDGKYFVGHIGDGIVLYKENSEFSVLSQPDNGCFVNQTYFIPIALEHSYRMRIYMGEIKKGMSFILASDGISDLIYDLDTNRAMNICNRLETWNKELSTEESSELIKKSLIDVLSQYTFDDMSVAVLSVL